MGRTKQTYSGALEWHQRPNEKWRCPICFAEPGAPITETVNIVHRLGEDGIIYWKHKDGAINGTWNSTITNGLFRAINLLKLKNERK